MPNAILASIPHTTKSLQQDGCTPHCRTGTMREKREKTRGEGQGEGGGGRGTQERERRGEKARGGGDDKGEGKLGNPITGAHLRNDVGLHHILVQWGWRKVQAQEEERDPVHNVHYLTFSVGLLGLACTSFCCHLQLPLQQLHHCFHINV